MSDVEETQQGAGSGAGSPQDESQAGPSELEQRLAAVEKERDETKDRMLRIAAEFENWKKRARKEQEESEAKAKESVLRDVLDVMDNLERALGAAGQPKANGKGAAAGGKATAASATDGPAVLKGVELVLRLFQTKLERYGVTPIVSVGQPFDPRQHEAISRVETTDVPPGHVAVEMQRGYKIGDRLLRPSFVGVATAPTRTEGSAGGAEGETA